MEERQVEVIKKVEGPVIRDRRLVGKPLTITRKRVAAYVRVSTNAEEQLQSFKSQKEYYQDKISANKEWALVGIYADEGITGTKTTKRDEFLRMIDDCMNGLVDIVITKSVSRFSRNLVDVLSYTRMLKAKGVTVILRKKILKLPPWRVKCSYHFYQHWRRMRWNLCHRMFPWAFR